MHRLTAWITVLLLCMPLHSRALEALPLKAAIVFNLLLFVEWPGEAELPPSAPLLLCADGSAPLWPQLKLLQDRPMRQRRLEVQEVSSADAQRACHAWLLEDGGQRPLAARVSGAGPVLVIGDGLRADEAGVIVALRTAGTRMQFDVNLAEARLQRLQLSSKLLRLARVVRE